MCDKEPTIAEIREDHEYAGRYGPTMKSGYLYDAHNGRGILLKKLKAAQKLTKQWRKPGASVWNECAKQMDEVLDGE